MKEINKLIEIDLTQENVISKIINDIVYEYDIDFYTLLNDVKECYMHANKKIGILILEENCYCLLNETELDYLNKIEYTSQLIMS